MVGSLQCGSEMQAKKFECSIPSEICSCLPQEEKVSCNCRNVKIEPLFSNPNYVLPIESDGISLEGEGKKLTAQFQSIASLEMQITMKDLELTYLEEQNTCKIEVINTSGCYNCLTGMKLEFKCTTDKGEGLAIIHCGTKAMFSTRCTEKGIKDKTTLMFQQAEINELCQVRCATQTTSLNLTATLIFIKKDPLTKTNTIVVGKEDPGRMDFNLDLGFIGKWLKNNWLKFIGLIILILILVFVTIMVLPLILQTFIKAGQNLQQKVKTKFKNFKTKLSKRFKSN